MRLMNAASSDCLMCQFDQFMQQMRSAANYLTVSACDQLLLIPTVRCSNYGIQKHGWQPQQY